MADFLQEVTSRKDQQVGFQKLRQPGPEVACTQSPPKFITGCFDKQDDHANSVRLSSMELNDAMQSAI